MYKQAGRLSIHRLISHRIDSLCGLIMVTHTVDSYIRLEILNEESRNRGRPLHNAPPVNDHSIRNFEGAMYQVMIPYKGTGEDIAQYPRRFTGRCPHYAARPRAICHLSCILYFDSNKYTTKKIGIPRQFRQHKNSKWPILVGYFEPLVHYDPPRTSPYFLTFLLNVEREMPSCLALRV